MAVLKDKALIGAPHDNLSVKHQLTSHTYKTMGSHHMIPIFDQARHPQKTTATSLKCLARYYG